MLLHFSALEQLKSIIKSYDFKYLHYYSTRFVNCVSIIKLCTCFSALDNSNFRANTATIVAVQDTPLKRRIFKLVYFKNNVKSISVPSNQRLHKQLFHNKCLDINRHNRSQEKSLFNKKFDFLENLRLRSINMFDNSPEISHIEFNKFPCLSS